MIAILNGPLLHLVGKRTPSQYGHTTMEQVVIEIQQRWMDEHFIYHQSNHEGDIIDWILQMVEDNRCEGIVINPGAYTHTSIAIRDAIEYAQEQGTTVVEVHISNIYEREEFRQHSLITSVCSHSIIGHGTNGYIEAVQWIKKQ